MALITTPNCFLKCLQRSHTFGHVELSGNYHLHASITVMGLCYIVPWFLRPNKEPVEFVWVLVCPETSLWGLLKSK